MAFSTFKESESLKMGENLERLLEYIEKCKICISIISKKYADSKWCLKEFAKIIECNKKITLGLFDVDPLDVEKQSDSFAFGFENHESNGKLKQEEKSGLHRSPRHGRLTGRVGR
ncbi:Disease resistance protein [Nymphaea thermarum]|nr:Disease resistance protein [Nymphaea thermarum]